MAPRISVSAPAAAQGTSAFLLTPKIVASYFVIDRILAANAPFSFPPRVRPTEFNRVNCIIRNIGTTTVQIGFGSTTNSVNAPGSFPFSIAPGQELDLSGTAQSIFARVSASATAGFKIGVYTELAV